MNLDLLKQHDIPEQTPEQFAQTCNTVLRKEWKLIDKIDAMNYLSLNRIWERLEAIVLNPAQYGEFAARIKTFLTVVQTFPKTNPVHFAADIPALEFAGIITSEEAAGFLALGQRDVTQYEDWSGEASTVVTPRDVVASRNLEAVESLRDLESLLNSAHGDVLGVVQQARAALLAGDVVEMPTAASIVARFTQTLEANAG